MKYCSLSYFLLCFVFLMGCQDSEALKSGNVETVAVQKEALLAAKEWMSGNSLKSNRPVDQDVMNDIDAAIQVLKTFDPQGTSKIDWSLEGGDRLYELQKSYMFQREHYIVTFLLERDSDTASFTVYNAKVIFCWF